MKKSFVLASLFIIFFSSKVLSLDFYPTFGPLATRTQNPLSLLFLVPVPDKTATLHKGEWQFHLSTTVTNLLERSLFSSPIAYDLDMEIVRTTFNFSYGFYPDFEVGAEIPFLTLNGGFLDGFLQDYHHTFGFPNGGRDQVANGRFSYLISKNGDQIYHPSQRSFGLSDITLYLKKNFLKEQKKVPGLSLSTFVKVPLGDRGKGFGSGSPDVGFQLVLEKSYWRFHSYTGLGYLLLGPFAPLESYQHSQVFTLFQSLEFNLTHIASLVAQIQTQSSLFYQTGTVLDRMPLDLVVGFKGVGAKAGAWKHFEWEFAFSEDLRPTSPSVDLSVRFNLGAKF